MNSFAIAFYLTFSKFTVALMAVGLVGQLAVRYAIKDVLDRDKVAKASRVALYLAVALQVFLGVVLALSGQWKGALLDLVLVVGTWWALGWNPRATTTASKKVDRETEKIEPVPAAEPDTEPAAEAPAAQEEPPAGQPVISRPAPPSSEPTLGFEDDPEGTEDENDSQDDPATGGEADELLDLSGRFTT